MRGRDEPESMNTTPPTDGRRQRAFKNKRKVAETALDITLETGEAPAVDAIVERSGISRRTVFRLFNNKDELFADIANLMLQRVQKRFPFPAPDPGRSLEDTVRLSLDLRIQINEYIRPLRKIVGEKKRTNSRRRDRQNKTRQFEQQLIHDLFAPYLHDHPDRELLERLLLLNGSWKVWAVLRDDYGLSIEESRMVLERQIFAVLGM